jgi:hypothetical protein
MLVVAGLIAAVVVRTTDAASIRSHTTALLYCDATDQLGYAQAADWLMAHPVKIEAEATPQSPCNAWLCLLLRLDPRFGVYFYTAIVATLRGTSGSFAYDVACALSLSAGILGVAGVFARSRWSLVVLLIGLLVCQWYDDSRIGYFGKLNGYPAVVMVAGLFLLLRRRLSIESIVVLAMLTAAAAIMHSGMGTAMFIAPIAAVYLLARVVLANSGARAAELQSAWKNAVLLALLMGTALVATGLPARPAYNYAPDFLVNWPYILPRSLDIEHAGANIHNWPDDGRPPLIYGHEEKLVSGLGVRNLRRLTRLACAVWLALAAGAILWRDPRAIGLLLGPMLLLVGLWIANRGPEAFQMTGYLYPTSLCGIARLMDKRVAPLKVNWRIAVVALAVICIGLRIPRYAGSVQRYAGRYMPKNQIFTKRNTDRLVAASGGDPVEVDIPSLTHLLFVVIEIGHRDGVHLQWTPESFYAAFRYTHWPSPAYPPARRKLVLASDPVPPGWRVTFRAFPLFLITRDTRR